MKCFFRYKGLESQPQSAVKMLNMQTVCSSTFRGKTTKSLLSTVRWIGQLCSCLITTLHGDVASDMK